MHKDLKINNM